LDQKLIHQVTNLTTKSLIQTIKYAAFYFCEQIHDKNRPNETDISKLYFTTLIQLKL